MKKTLLLKTMLLLCALVVGTSSSWADETPIYTLSFTKLSTSGTGNADNSNYTNPHNTTSSGVQWTVQGNQTLGNYIRVGGKNTTNTDRTLTSNAVLSTTKAIERIVINHNGTGNGSNCTITVNSLTVEGSTNSSFTSSKSKTITNPSVSSSGSLVFTLDEGTWDANSYFRITMNYKITTTKSTNNCYLTINDVKFYEYVAPESGTTAAPTINGDADFFTTRTVSIQNAASASGAAIYYTLNGDDPTITTSETCFAYSEPFEISATTTVKAIAKLATDDNASSVTSKTFTKKTALNGISALNSTTTDGTYYVNLTDAQFTYINGSQGYLNDANAGIIYYNSSAKPVLKKTYNGIYQVAKTVYNGMPELTNLTEVSGECTTTIATEIQAPVVLTVSELDENFSDHLARQIQINDYTVTDAANLTSNVGFYTNWFNPNLTVGKTYTLVGYPYLNNTTKQFRIVSAFVPATISNAEYATFNSANALDFSGTGVNVYTATDMGSYVKLNEISSGQVPAGTPVVLYKTGGGTVNVPVIASAEDILGTNHLRVSTGSDVENMFVLAKKNNKVGFYKWAGSTDLSTGKVYLQGLATSSARDFLGFDNTATGINNVEISEESDDSTPMYNLAGQRVNKSYKGVVIVNGKKVVRK